MAFDTDTAPELGRVGGLKSGEVRRARAAAATLTAEEVSAGLAAMTTPDAIRRNLEQIQRWACAGRLNSGNANASVRACAEALKALELGVELDEVKALTARLDLMDTERKARRVA